MAEPLQVVSDPVHIVKHSPTLDEVDSVTLCGRTIERTEHQDHGPLTDDSYSCTCGAPLCERCRVKAKELRQRGWVWKQ